MRRMRGSDTVDGELEAAEGGESYQLDEENLADTVDFQAPLDLEAPFSGPLNKSSEILGPPTLGTGDEKTVRMESEPAGDPAAAEPKTTSESGDATVQVDGESNEDSRLFDTVDADTRCRRCPTIGN